MAVRVFIGLRNLVVECVVEEVRSGARRRFMRVDASEPARGKRFAPGFRSGVIRRCGSLPHPDPPEGPPVPDADAAAARLGLEAALRTELTGLSWHEMFSFDQGRRRCRQR